MSVIAVYRLADQMDAVRLIVRPFMTEILCRKKETTVQLTLDMGCSEHERSMPWFKVLKRERSNDHHLAVAAERAARGAA